MAIQILLVDDDAEVLRMCAAALGESGYLVFTAGSAIEALLMELTGFDLVVSDFSMPGMNGLELLREVRKKNSRCGFVLMSSGVGDIELEALKKAGRAQYIKKPFTIDLLLETINAFESGPF